MSLKPPAENLWKGRKSNRPNIGTYPRSPGFTAGVLGCQLNITKGMNIMITFNAKTLAAVAIAQSTESCRYYLCGVYFAGNKAVATDGHLMSVATQEDADNGAGSIFPVSKKAITAMKKRNAENVTIENNLLTVFTDDGEVLHIEPCREIDGTFPDWQRVVPNETGEACHAAINYPLVERIAQTAKVLNGTGNSPISLKGADGSSPHVVKYHNNSAIFSVVMPIRP